MPCTLIGPGCSPQLPSGYKQTPLLLPELGQAQKPGCTPGQRRLQSIMCALGKGPSPQVQAESLTWQSNTNERWNLKFLKAHLLSGECSLVTFIRNEVQFPDLHLSPCLCNGLRACLSRSILDNRGHMTHSGQPRPGPCSENQSLAAAGPQTS